MPRKELKPAMERVNEIKNKAKAESNTATLEVPEGWEGTTEVPGTEVKVTARPEPSINHEHEETIKKLDAFIIKLVSLQETEGQNTIRIMQEFKDIKDRLETIESVLTKLVILSGNTNPKPAAEPESKEASELEPYTHVINEVKNGLKYVKSQGGSRIKFEGAGPNIIGILAKKGLNIPNAEEFKAILRGTPGFTYYAVDNSFSYEGE